MIINEDNNISTDRRIKEKNWPKNFFINTDFNINREYTPTLLNGVCHELPKVKSLDKRDRDVVRSIL